MRRFLVSIAVVPWLLVSAASAQDVGLDEFRLDRYHAPPTTEDGLVIQLPTTLGHMRWSAGVMFDYAHAPLVLENLDTGEEFDIVGNRMAAHVVAALGLTDMLEVHLRLPLLLASSGDAPTVGGLQFDTDGFALIDPAVGGSVSFIGEEGEPGLQAGLNAELRFPGGGGSSLASDEGVGFVANLVGAYALDIVTFALSLGVEVRPSNDFGTSKIGTELPYALGVYVRPVDGLSVMAELWGAPTFRADEDVLAVQALVGARYTLDMGLSLGGGVGLGLTQAAGVPDVRVLFGAGYAPPRAEPEGDRDGDGYLDSQDGCPDQPEDFDQFEDEDGCPDPDNDGDGILDPNDACPNVAEDADQFEDEDGCPDPDNDRDQIPDTADQCPNVAEDRDGFEDDNGCPDPDNDQDTVLDEDDRCPLEPGDPANDGCPVRVQLEETQIRILQRIEFDTDRATLRPESVPVLQDVLGVIQQNPQIRRIRIEGHTDSTADDRHNQRLSQARAEAVRDWLVQNGVDRGRLEPRGFGESRPLESNTTEEGRQANRRVEFHWNEGDVVPVQK